MHYSQLPKKAHRFIKPVGLPDQLRLPTKRHYVCRGFALLGLLPLSASLLMAITLDGGEQTFYQFVVALLLPTLFILGTLKHHLVLDNPSQQRFVQLQFWGYHFKKIYQAPLKSTALLLRHDSHDRSLYELKLHDLIYPIGSLTDTTQVVTFFAHTFNIPAQEQISDFPNIHPLDIYAQAVSPVTSANKDAPATHKDVQQNLDALNATNKINQSPLPSIFIEPLWKPKLLIRFFYPLPFLIAFGVVMKFFGGLLNAL